MKVKIKKDGKKKTYKLIDSWADVNMETWAKVVSLEAGSKVKEAEETIAALSDIPLQLVKSLAIRDVAVIMGKLSELQSESGQSLKKVIEIDGVEYGMHPNLDDITLGEYADIESFIKNGIQNNMPELMAVLFRPIVEKKGDIYAIEAYDGNIAIRAEEMKKMSAENVQSCLVFFWIFAKELLKITPSVLQARAAQMKKEQLMATLRKNGDGSE